MKIYGKCEGKFSQRFYINLICEDVQRKCEDGEYDDMGNEGNGFVDGLVMVALSAVCLCVIRVRFV